jgi:hypothetical protein
MMASTEKLRRMYLKQLETSKSFMREVIDLSSVVNDFYLFTEMVAAETKAMNGLVDIATSNANIMTEIADMGSELSIQADLFHNISLADTLLSKTAQKILPIVDTFAEMSWFSSIAHANIGTMLSKHQLIAIDFMSDIDALLNGNRLYLPDLFMDVRLPSLLWSIEGLDIEPKNESVRPDISIANITLEWLRYLGKNPEELSKLTPAQFVDLVLSAFETMNYQAIKVQDSVYTSDGGVDIIARPNIFPMHRDFIAIQVKHHRSPKKKVDSPTVRDLAGVLSENRTYFNAAILVTNTAFTSAARKLEEPYLLLKDGQDLIQWLKGNFATSLTRLKLDKDIELKGGIVIPKSRWRKLF